MITLSDVRYSNNSDYFFFICNFSLKQQGHKKLGTRRYSRDESGDVKCTRTECEITKNDRINKPRRQVKQIYQAIIINFFMQSVESHET